MVYSLKLPKEVTFTSESKLTIWEILLLKPVLCLLAG